MKCRQYRPTAEEKVEGCSWLRNSAGDYLPLFGHRKYGSAACILYFFFLKKFLADTCPFLGPLVPLFWISGDVSSGFQSQSGLPYSHRRRKIHCPRSTSGATLADLLAASVQPVLSPHTSAEVRLPGFELVLSEYLWTRRSTNWAKPGSTMQSVLKSPACIGSVIILLPNEILLKSLCYSIVMLFYALQIKVWQNRDQHSRIKSHFVATFLEKNLTAFVNSF